MNVTRGILDKQTGQVVGKEEHTIEKDECNRPDTTIEGLARAQAALRSEERAGNGDGRQLLATVRRRIGRATDVAAACRGARHQAEGRVSRLRGRRVRAG